MLMLVQATVSNATFHGNSADSGGAAAYVAVNTTVSMDHSSFTANQASKGGGVYLDTSSALTAIGCTIDMNNASSGGGVYCHGGSFQAVKLSFTHNNAVDYGGGLCALNQAQVTHSSLSDKLSVTAW